MKKRLLLVIVLITLLTAGCTGPRTQTPGPITESPKTTETSAPADVIFAYGRVLEYWTSEEHLASEQIVKGLCGWRLEQVEPKMQQAQQENKVVLSSLYSIPNESNFQPVTVGTEGSLYNYTLSFGTNEAAKPETICIPPLSTSWSQFSTGLNVDTQVNIIDSQKGIESVTIRISPQRSFSQLWVSLETDKDVNLLSDTAIPPMNQWNVSPPQLNKTYTFSVQLQLKTTASEAELYKPRANIGAITTPVSQKKQSGQHLETEVPGLGSLTFQATGAGVLELDRSDQIVIYLWQSSISKKNKAVLLPPINGWGFCKSIDAKQNPVGNSLLFSSEDSQVNFWADIDVQAFEKAVSLEFEWIDPNGQSQQTKKISLASTDNTRIYDTISLKKLGEGKLGTWHVKLLLDGEPILTPFFLVATPEELQATPIPEQQIKTPHFVIGDEPFRFVGAFVPDGSFNHISAEKLIATAKMSGFSVLTLFLPWSQNPGDESSLRQLDVFLDRASAHGVYVIVTFVQGFGLSLDKTSPLYTPRGIEGLIHDQKLKAAYKNLLTRVVTRKNTMNGRMYRDDPTIMAWDLITEPTTGEWMKVDPLHVTGEEFKSWLQEMAGHIRNLDPNHLVTMCVTGSISSTFKGWPDVIMPELDFFFCDTNLFDTPYLNDQPITEDYISYYYDYPVYSIGKPVVSQLAFTSDKLDEKFATDHKLQGQIYRDALLKGFQRGMAGATIFSWGNPPINELRIPLECYLTYDATDEQIVVPLLMTAASLGTLDWPKPPLQFVRVAP